MEVTKHCIQRYVERIMNMNSSDIPVYIAQNEDTIVERINKLYEYSDYVCSGKIKEHDYTHFYINNDGWVLIINKDRLRIVTLYKVDLELDSEFNKIYVEKFKMKLKDNYDILTADEFELLDIRTKNSDSISENNNDIKDLKSKINYLDECNKLLLQDNLVKQQEFSLKQKEFYKQVEKFIGAKVFE